MTFLKLLGWAVTAVGEVTGFLPAIKAFLVGISPNAAGAVGTIGDVLTKVVGVVQQVEVVFASFASTKAKTGGNKLQASIPAISAILQEYVSSGVLGATKIKDQALFLSACAKIGSGAADLMNSLEAPGEAPTEAQVEAGQAAIRGAAAPLTAGT